MTVMKQMRDFLEGAMLDQIIDAVAKITQATLGTLDIRKCGLIGDHAFQAFCVNTHVWKKITWKRKRLPLH